MPNQFAPLGYQLPTQPQLNGGFSTQGFVTPQQDLLPQVFAVPPRRVLPIIFLPGIMGSNLRMNAARQRQMGRKNNIAWRPDSLTQAQIFMSGSPGMRQNQLDPDTTEVDEYDPVKNPTGDPKETADMRHDVVKAKLDYMLGVGINTPLLMDDPVAVKPRRTKDQKARERGWGEIFFKSYQEVLELCELHLNTAFSQRQLSIFWKGIIDVPPARWQASPQPALKPLDEATLRETVKNCWFPVHAMGYNWLQSNKKSGMHVAERIDALIKRYQDQGYKCEKVIVVTHSMGGLVARALIHPDMGKLNGKVLGIVHGVMPATGAAAAYKRMRCGFEDPGLNSLSPIDSVTSKVLGNFGTEVTAVLGNAQGGLELLPSQAYGNNWLRVMHKGQTLKSLPQKGDPYEEIYKLRGKWYGLLREDWINPAQHADAGYGNTGKLLDKAKAFHNAISRTYHDQSFAHYGADPGRAAWHNVIWELDEKAKVLNVEDLQIATDNRQGILRVTDPRFPSRAGEPGPQFTATLLAPSEPGDQTVPLHSADDQLRSGKFRGLFRQMGYEHQNSYKDERAFHSTLYSLVRIAQTMKWSSP